MIKIASGAIDLRDAYVQWHPGPAWRTRDCGGYLYMADGRMIERWPAESEEHAIRRNGQDWRPVP